MMATLTDAMRAVEFAEDEEARGAGMKAIEAAMIEIVEPVKSTPSEDRQRQLDAALDDAIEIVSRHRWRLGQRVGQDDGKIVRRIHALLRGLGESPS